jgi:hypothetical protein
MKASYDSCRGLIFIRNYFEVNSKHQAQRNLQKFTLEKIWICYKYRIVSSLEI